MELTKMQLINLKWIKLHLLNLTGVDIVIDVKKHLNDILNVFDKCIVILDTSNIL